MGIEEMSPSMHTEYDLANRVSGNLILFNDNGAWCWFQDERVIVDPTNNTMLIGSIAAAAGSNGEQRNGNIELVSYDPATGGRRRIVLHERLEADDHDAAALLVRSDGRYLAMYTKHNADHLSRWRISKAPHDASHWTAEAAFDWSKLTATTRTTYSNLHYLAAEKRTYNFARAINDDPSVMVSTDQGDTWSYGGKLLTIEKLGYVNGYVRYASNGVDRIDFITTEHHPNDFNNSIYHGYIKGGRLHKSDGTVVDDGLFASGGGPQTRLTKIFAANRTIDGDVMTRAWTTDLRLDRDGHPVALVTARANDVPENSNFEDHRFFYVRFDGKQWHVHQLAKAGAGLLEAEQDYTGLGALVPHDADKAFISTPIDPRDGSNLKHYEIFRGVTSDGGARWDWTPITQNSSVDNVRPVVPVWDRDHTAVLWLRGTMRRSQDYDMAVVGIIESKTEHTVRVKYARVDPSTSERGRPFSARLTDLTAGAYDVFVFFWANEDSDGHIRAGLTPDRMMHFRHPSCQAADPNQFDDEVVFQSRPGARLYRSYIGRADVREGAVEVFIDEQFLGTDDNRNSLDGIGCAQVLPGEQSEQQPEPQSRRSTGNWAELRSTDARLEQAVADERRRNQAMRNTIHRIEQALAEERQRSRELLFSTTWRATAPLRALGNRYPRLARLGRRGLKLLWWTVTLQLVRRLSAVRTRQPTATRSEPPPSPIPARPPATIHVDSSDERGRELIRCGGDLNPPTLKMWRHLLVAESWTHVVDVGANYGEMLFNVTLPPGARILAFEPNPLIWPHLERNLAEAGIAAEIRRCAVSDRVGKAQLLPHRTWSGMTRLASPGMTEAETPQSLTVPTTTLAVALGGASAAPAMRALIKIDVEGHEVSVLRGVLEMLDGLEAFAALIEIIHMAPEHREWLLGHFDIELYDLTSNSLVRLVPAGSERLAQMLAEKRFHSQDVVLRRSKDRLQMGRASRGA